MDIGEKIKQLKVDKCLRCGRETNHDDSEEIFCTGCGTPLINRCSSYECDAFLDEISAYCKYCGSKSTFLNLKLTTSTITIEPDDTYDYDLETDNTEDFPF